MATVINNPDSGEKESGAGVGMLVGVLLVLALLAVIFFFFGLPYFRGATPPAENAGTGDDAPNEVNITIPNPLDDTDGESGAGAGGSQGGNQGGGGEGQ